MEATFNQITYLQKYNNLIESSLLKINNKKVTIVELIIVDYLNMDREKDMPA